MQIIMTKTYVDAIVFPYSYTKSETYNLLANKASTTGDVSINGGYLGIRPSQAQSKIKTHVNHVGTTGYMHMEGRYRDQGFLHFETNYQYGEMFLTVRNHLFIKCNENAGSPYVQTFHPPTQSSDDRLRLKENEEIT